MSLNWKPLHQPCTYVIICSHIYPTLLASHLPSPSIAFIMTQMSFFYMSSIHYLRQLRTIGLNDSAKIHTISLHPNNHMLTAGARSITTHVPGLWSAPARAWGVPVYTSPSNSPHVRWRADGCVCLHEGERAVTALPPSLPIVLTWSRHPPSIHSQPCKCLRLKVISDVPWIQSYIFFQWACLGTANDAWLIYIFGIITKFVPTISNYKCLFVTHFPTNSCTCRMFWISKWEKYCSFLLSILFQ